MLEVPHHIIDRYDEMLSRITSEITCIPDPGTAPAHLRWLLSQLRNPQPKFKASRWLGFIQYGVISYGLTTVSAERNYTRKYFVELSEFYEGLKFDPA